MPMTAVTVHRELLRGTVALKSVEAHDTLPIHGDSYILPIEYEHPFLDDNIVAVPNPFSPTNL